MSPNLSGKVCVVTGGSQGIGKGIALQLGEAGAIVYITGRNKTNLEKAAKEVKERGAQSSIPLQGKVQAPKYIAYSQNINRVPDHHIANLFDSFLSGPFK